MWYESTRLDWTIDALRQLNSIYWSFVDGYYDKPKNSWRVTADIKDVIEMAKKGKLNGHSTAAPERYSGAVNWNNVRLDDTDLLAIDEWQIDPSELLGEIIILVESGYSFSCKTEADGKTIGAYLISNRVGALDVGYGISGRAGAAFDACRVLLYKYFEKCERRCDYGVQTAPPKYS